MKTNYTRPYLNRLAMRNAPYHKKKVVFNVHLSPELKANHGIRSLPVRKDDTVSVKRGKYAGIQKRVTEVSFKKGKIKVEGVKTTKTDGTEIFHFIHPSNCILMSLGKLDEGRKNIISRKTGSKVEPGKEE
jgi:ribosomal protein uL24